MVQFCDSGLHATFTINQLFIYDSSTLYFRGRRNTANGLWHIDLVHQHTGPLTHDLRNTPLSTEAPPAPPAVANGLWHINLAHQPTKPLTHDLHNTPLPMAAPPEPLAVANSGYYLEKKRDIIVYLHRSCFRPLPSIWIKAIDAGFLSTWSSLTSKLVCAHMRGSTATLKTDQ